MQELKKNKKIAENIYKMLSSERMVHAFLFTGGSKESRSELGMWLAEQLLCVDEVSSRKFLHGNSEDLIVLEKPEDRESILKDQILELGEKLSFKPFGDKYVVIIKDADLINQTAQNKLLKSLEEPVAPTVFILLSARADALLPTIRSRCTCYSLEEEISPRSEETDQAVKKFISLIGPQHCYYKKKNTVLYLINDKENGRERTLEFLDVLEEELEKEVLAGNKYCAEALKCAEEAAVYIKQLHSVPYTLKQLCLRA